MSNPFGITVVLSDDITIGDVLEFQRMKDFNQIKAWLVKHCGSEPEKLDALKLREVKKFMGSIGDALREAMTDVPKENDPQQQP